MSETTTKENGTQTANESAATESNALSLQPKSGAVKTIGNRPVEASDLAIVGTFNSLGAERPIFANKMQIADSFYSSGMRPIAQSNLQISESYSVFGNRPVASNDIDDPADLIGYLD